MRQRLPDWLKRPIPASQGIGQTRAILASLNLHTVCQSAVCPNLGECFARSTSTFMILGEVCTRNCRFCAVPGGKPLPPDATEPQRVAAAVARLGLGHAVITSVTRDDLPDGGAAHFAATIGAIKARLPRVVVEVLVPDFRGSAVAIATVVEAGPHIVNHNLETVPRLYRQVRPGADYRRSLELLAAVKKLEPAMATKSGIMVGLGEEEDEVEALMRDLRRVECDVLTIGQYLKPSSAGLEVAAYLPPERFARFRELGEAMGFKHVAAGPFVRSSYHAEDLFRPAPCEP